MSLIIGKRFKAYSGGLKFFDTNLLFDAEIPEDERTILRPKCEGKRWKLARYTRMGTDFPDGAVLEGRSGHILPKATNAISKEHFEENSEVTELTELSADSSSYFAKNFVNFLDITPMACIERKVIQRPKKCSPKNQLPSLLKPNNEMLAPEQMPNLYAPWNTALQIAHAAYMAAHPPKSNITLLEIAKNRCKLDSFSERLLFSLKNRQRYC